MTLGIWVPGTCALWWSQLGGPGSGNLGGCSQSLVTAKGRRPRRSERDATGGVTAPEHAVSGEPVQDLSARRRGTAGVAPGKSRRLE